MVKFCNEATDLYLENSVGEVFTSGTEWNKYLFPGKAIFQTNSRCILSGGGESMNVG